MTGRWRDTPGLLTFRAILKRYFWLWIAYQTVKGLATTTFIWVPLAYLFLAK